MLWNIVSIVPGQIPIVEWGLGDGSARPAANSAFTSGWFDTWAGVEEKVIQPVTGQVVDTGDESVFGSGQVRRPGIYFLDVFCRQANEGNKSLVLHVDQIMAPALFSIGFTAFVPSQDVIVPPAGLSSAPGNLAARVDAFVARRIRIANRMVRVRFTFPNFNCLDWYLSAILRSA